MTMVSPSLVVGNWTTNSASANAVALAEAIVRQACDISGVNVVLCPPFVSWPDVCTATSGTSIMLGAPAILYKGDTGELSGEQMVEMSAMMLANRFDHVIVGHWEWHESNQIVARETAAALRHGIRPIICVGDTHEQKNGELFEETMRRQVSEALSGVPTNLPPGALVIAYEPVWAIQSKQPVDEVERVLATLREVIDQELDKERAAAVPLLFGGSVSSRDAERFAAAGFNGVLVSGATLDANVFLAIARAFSTHTGDGGQPPFTLPEPQSGDPDVADVPLTPEQAAVSHMFNRGLLPVISELENAFQYLDEREAQGLQLIRDKLQLFQDWQNIARVGEIGEPFDPEIHHAIGTDERSNYPSRHVVEVVQPGYRIGGDVVQKAEVIVNR